MVLYPNDYKIGTKEEAELLPLIKSYFKRDIKKSENETARHDYFDDEFNYELKTRKNAYNQYSTTRITTDKLCGEKRLILIFNFTDGIYYIEYNKEKFAEYDLIMFSRTGFKCDTKENIEIPIKDLTFICSRENAYSKGTGCLLLHLVKRR